MWWLLIPALILILLLYLLFVPLIIEVNSVAEIFNIRFGRLAWAGLGLEEDFIIVYWHLPFYNRKIKLFEKRITTVNKNKEHRPVHKSKKRTVPFRKIVAIMNSFRVRSFYMTIDTGDNLTNGLLYPAVCILRKNTGLDISVNFRKENDLILIIKNNIARMLWAFIRH